jgi:hypothetical protein
MGIAFWMEMCLIGCGELVKGFIRGFWRIWFGLDSFGSDI